MSSVIQIITNNYCNLHCEYCSLTCHLPFSENSKIVSHRKKWDMPISDAKLFCERLEGHYTDSLHKLLGGETTAMPPKRLYAIIDVFIEHNRKLKLLSNGFNIFGLRKKYLNKLTSIELNDHGINHTHIDNCIKYLETFYKGELIRRTQKKHYDLMEARKHCTIGYPCNSIMVPPVLYRGIIYPCCIHPSMEAWTNNWKMFKSLKQDGWGLDNPDLGEVLSNWRYKIPEYVVNECSFNCWAPKRLDAHIERTPITLKQNDVVRKRV